MATPEYKPTAADIQAQITRMEYAYDNLFIDKNLTERYEDLQRQLRELKS